MDRLRYSVVIPVYRNEASLPQLVGNLDALAGQLPSLEVVFVVDGSPDNSFLKLRQLLPSTRFESNLLSRNVGSFAAVTAGMSMARGEYIAVIAADLQEPPELPARFFGQLEAGDVDVVIGQRLTRDDPLLSKLAATLFWGLYRRLVQKDLPPGGIDVFGCNRQVRDLLVSFPEANTSLVGLLLWVGFRRSTIGYQRLVRQHGRSAWSLQRKLRYLKDSIFAFSDLPIRILGWIGTLGIVASVGMASLLVVLKLAGGSPVPGYAATVIVILFFGGLNTFGLSLIGEYIWRNFENSKQRPRYIISRSEQFSPVAGLQANQETPI